MTRPWLIIPVKSLAGGKSRLAVALIAGAPTRAQRVAAATYARGGGSLSGTGAHATGQSMRGRVGARPQRRRALPRRASSAWFEQRRFAGAAQRAGARCRRRDAGCVRSAALARTRSAAARAPRRASDPRAAALSGRAAPRNQCDLSERWGEPAHFTSVATVCSAIRRKRDGDHCRFACFAIAASRATSIPSPNCDAGVRNGVATLRHGDCNVRSWPTASLGDRDG